MITNLLLVTLSLSALAEDADSISAAETSYTGATMLEGEIDIYFDGYESLDSTQDESYAYFAGNTLYVGNQDDCGNQVDAIVEFFWFESSIDRGSDFYVGIIKARSTPDPDCQLWTTNWTSDVLGEYPVLSVNAITDVSREAGAFRWDWAVPFENYGIDSYGQVSITNSYGLGGQTEGAAMAHGEYQLDEDGNIKAEGNVQAKGYVSSEYKVQTQYDINLYEWDVYVSGSADEMDWDTYLNLDARADQSAYHEYFLSVQVEEGEPFMMDELIISGNFDDSFWNPMGFSEVGVALQNIMISAPEYVEEEEEEEEDWSTDIDTDIDNDWDDWYDYDEDVEEEEEVIEEDVEEEEVEENADIGLEEADLDDNDQVTPPFKGGCSATTLNANGAIGGLALGMLLAMTRRRED
jgi:hypothetical protein